MGTAPHFAGRCAVIDFPQDEIFRQNNPNRKVNR
jgi:hypothetical protein